MSRFLESSPPELVLPSVPDSGKCDMENRHGRTRFLVSSVSSDSHTWNLVFLQLLIEEYGHEVVNLGACVPDALFVEACRTHRPDVAVVSSVNGHGHLDGLRLIRHLRAQPDLAGLTVVIGGMLGSAGPHADRTHAEALRTAGYDRVFTAPHGTGQFEDFLRTGAPLTRRALPGAVR